MGSMNGRKEGFAGGTIQMGRPSHSSLGFEHAVGCLDALEQTLSKESMHPWLRWFGYIKHISYALESLMVSEVSTSFPIPERELILVSLRFLDASSHVRLAFHKGQVTVI